jgi:hypothetical protein
MCGDQPGGQNVDDDAEDSHEAPNVFTGNAAAEAVFAGTIPLLLRLQL